MVSRRGRAGLAALALLLACASRAARSQDILLSPKERSTSVSLADNAYKTGDGFPLGPVRLHPFLQQRLLADDNVFLETREKTWGAFYEATGGLRADVLPGSHEFSAGYKARGYYLLAHGEPDLPAVPRADYEENVEGLDRLEHVVDGRGLLAFPWGRFEAYGGWESLSDSLNFVYSSNIRRRIWGGGASAKVEKHRVRMELSGSMRRFDFDGEFDYMDHWLGDVVFDAGFLVAPKLHVLAGYTYARIVYGRMTAAETALYGGHGDVETHSATLGLRGALWPKLEILLRAGAAANRILEGLGDGLEPSFFALARVIWTATERVRLEASYSRDFQVSQLASLQAVDGVEATASYAFSHWVSARAYANVKRASPTEGDSFLRWTAGAQFEYRPWSWLALGAGYEWRARDCDRHNASFRNHRAWVHLTILF